MKTYPKNQSQKNSGLLSHPDQTTEDKTGSVYDLITERIVALLEAGTVPWRKTWKTQSGFPRNLVSGKPYRGINVFLLHSLGYESLFWLTFKQTRELGGSVRRGEKACPVVFWKRFDVENKETGEIEQIPMLRYYFVFNVAQCAGLKEIPQSSAELPRPSTPDDIITAMPQRPQIKHGMRNAFYSMEEDFIGMPDRARFDDAPAYYTTLFHELIHSTGHATRLNRDTLTESTGYGSDPYGKEELIAEMGAAFLCGHAGIVENTINDSAAYLSGWLEKLKNDKKLIVQAAAKAQRAADFILGVQFEKNRKEGAPKE